jgi:hypothetical protein
LPVHAATNRDVILTGADRWLLTGRSGGMALLLGRLWREHGDTSSMTETEFLIAEVRQLRADVARLHAAHTAVHIRHGWMKPFVKDLSTNPYTQYKVHMWGAIYWLINFPLICCLFFFTPTLWLKLGIFITLIYSIYANLATDYGAMSAAEAAFGQPPPPPIPLEPPTTIPSM